MSILIRIEISIVASLKLLNILNIKNELFKALYIFAKTFWLEKGFFKSPKASLK